VKIDIKKLLMVSDPERINEVTGWPSKLDARYPIGPTIGRVRERRSNFILKI
jgi:hypothetical protein